MCYDVCIVYMAWILLLLLYFALYCHHSRLTASGERVEGVITEACLLAADTVQGLIIPACGLVAA